MLRRFFGRGVKTRPGSIPAGHAAYTIGDIHGRLDLLKDLLSRISEDARRHYTDQMRHLVLLGDYIDRGPQSRGVVECLLGDPMAGFSKTYLMGNHEEAMLSFLEGLNDGLEWLSFGGLETLLSYGVPLRSLPRTKDDMLALREALAGAVPRSHLDFLKRCVLHHLIGDYLFVHAGVRPGITLERQNPTDLMWIRDNFLRSKVPMPGRIVVHGHTICDLPQNREYRINIDTGAFASGRLTCLVLRGSDRRFLSTAGDT